MRVLRSIALFLALAFVPVACVFANATFGQANSVTCPASGTSAQVLAAKASRESYLVSNTSGKTVLVGFAATGTAALTSANSIQLLAGQAMTDSAPSIFLGRIMCMSSDGTTATIYAIETRKQ